MHGVLLIVALVIAVVAALRGLWSPCGLSMVSSLNPVSEGARGHSYWATCAWYIVGAATGGALLGAGFAVGAFGVGRAHLGADAVTALMLAAAAAACLSDVAPFGWSLPMHPRQVNEQWLTRYRRWIYAAGYGAQIGTGFATYIMTAAVYLMACLAVLTGSPAQAFGVGLAFGVVRGLSVLSSAPAQTPDALRALLRRVDRAAEMSLIATMGIEVLVAATAAWMLSGPVAAVVVAGVLAVVVGRSEIARRRASQPDHRAIGRVPLPR